MQVIERSSQHCNILRLKINNGPTEEPDDGVIVKKEKLRETEKSLKNYEEYYRHVKGLHFVDKKKKKKIKNQNLS